MASTSFVERPPSVQACKFDTVLCIEMSVPAKKEETQRASVIAICLKFIVRLLISGGSFRRRDCMVTRVNESDRREERQFLVLDWGKLGKQLAL